jgi:hypothetical protein
VVCGRATACASAAPAGTWSAADSLRALRVHALQRLVLRSAATPLRAVWVLGYRAVARAAGWLLARDVPGASVYLRAGAAGGELLPGMSDIDLAVVVPDGGERVRRRWSAALARMPWLDRLVDWPLILREQDLGAVAGGCALTFGLEDGRAAYFGDDASVDVIRTLEHPGLSAPTAGWRLLRGAERRPAPPPRDAQHERLAAWSEVLLWWRWAFVFCDQPRTPRAADVCVKLISEPARAWLWLAHRERAAGRADALARLAERLPEEEPAARLALELQRRMPTAPPAPFAEVLPALVRMTRRIDALIEAELAGGPVDEVSLAGAPPPGCGPLPLVDWPAVAAPAAFAETFTIAPGDPGDPAALAESVRAHELGVQRALRSDGLLVVPARPLPRSRMRAVKSRTTDPVSFALAAGAGVARFSRVAGWSVGDLAARAVAEHRAWLRTRLVPPAPWSSPPPPSHELGMLLSAGRAGLLAASIDTGAPELIAGADELGRRLGPAGEEGVAAHAAAVQGAAAPPPGVAAALEARVAALAAYS